MAAYLKVLPLFMMVFPGMVSRVLFPDQVACADPDTCLKVCSNPSGCSDIAYPKLVLELLPTVPAPSSPWTSGIASGPGRPRGSS